MKPLTAYILQLFSEPEFLFSRFLQLKRQGIEWRNLVQDVESEPVTRITHPGNYCQLSNIGQTAMGHLPILPPKFTGSKARRGRYYIKSTETVCDNHQTSATWRIVRLAVETELVSRRLVEAWLWSALLWLTAIPLVGRLLSIKFHNPEFMGGLAWWTFGRLRPVHVNGVIFGSFTTTFLGLLYYYVPKLCGAVGGIEGYQLGVAGGSRQYHAHALGESSA